MIEAGLCPSGSPFRLARAVTWYLAPSRSSLGFLIRHERAKETSSIEVGSVPHGALYSFCRRFHGLLLLEFISALSLREFGKQNKQYSFCRRFHGLLLLEFISALSLREFALSVGVAEATGGLGSDPDREASGVVWGLTPGRGRRSEVEPRNMKPGKRTTRSWHSMGKPVSAFVWKHPLVEHASRTADRQQRGGWQGKNHERAAPRGFSLARTPSIPSI